MITYNHKYVSNEQLSDFITQHEITDSSSLFIRIHSAIHTYKEMDELISFIKSYLPHSHIIGCSTSHIIMDGALIHGSCLISITQMERPSSITTHSISCKDDDGNTLEGATLGHKILEAMPQSDGYPLMLIFFPVSYSKIEAVINTINESNTPLFMIGGTAYQENETADNPPYVISGDNATPDDVAFMCINTPEGHAYCDFACGIVPVGKKSPIQASGNIIETVDGIQGGEWYASLLGKDSLDKNPSMSESFPVVIQGERDICYHVDYKKFDDKDGYYLETFPELRTGSLVSPGYFHPQKIFDQVDDVITHINDRPSETIFGYDCSARSAMLSNCAKWELSNFKSTDISGCLLSGEIITRHGTNFYANLTFVIASLSEYEDAKVSIKKPDVASLSELQNDNVDALNFLLVNYTNSLNKELEYQKDMIRDAVFFNPAVGIDNQLKFQFDSQNEKLNKAAILYLNNEKMMRIFSGVSETYNNLTDCYERLSTKFYSSSIHIYSFQDTSLLVAGNQDISVEDFEKLIDRMQFFLNSQIYEDIPLSYTAASLYDSKDPLSDLEMALDYANRNSLNRVYFNDITKSLEKEQENIHVLLVLREAISHDRIMPYFQEIHSNIPGKRRMFEALMRISDEDGKLYFPDTFLPIAKEYSLYDKLSEMMVQKLMEMFKDKNSRVTINLNVHDIYNRNMMKMIFDNMKSFPHPENYVFEIVESEEVTDYEYIKSFSEKIHDLGGKIAIDDFGSGFSNLLNIMRIDADYIKLDGAVVKEICNDTLVQDFVEFIQGWCSKNHQALICEYIENKEIQDYMEKFHVAYSQGYYFSKPHQWGPDDEN